MRNKEFYDLKRIDVIADYKLNGCGKIIPNTRIVQILYDGKAITKRTETNESVMKYVLQWAEEEKEDECKK